MEKTNITEIITKYFKAVCDAYSLGNVESSYNAPIMALFTDIGCAARDLSGERKGQSGENIDSFAKELLERESNVILLDEFDKPNPVFYSAFYQLFDEGVFADKNYTVTMKNAIIICTSNFLSEEQIRERLGDPIYSRFDAVIHFTDLQPEAVQKLLDCEIDRQYSKLDEEERAIIDSRKIVSLLKTNSYRLSNARQIKKFVREAFSATITDEVL